MSIEFVHLSLIRNEEIIALNNHPDVLRHMPLAAGVFDETQCKEWVKEKESQWEMYGYGPRAFLIDGRFAGWGGLQYEQGYADLALVLHPAYWGYGLKLFRKIVSHAFQEMGLESITILLPTTRLHTKIIRRLGFLADGRFEINGVPFFRYRLPANDYQYKVDCTQE